MAKRIISFMVIFIAYCVIGAAFLIWMSGSVARLSAASESGTVLSAFAVNRAGNIYYISDKNGEKSLACTASSGELLFEKTLDSEIFGVSFTVRSIYVEHDNDIYLTVYEYNEQTLLVEKAAIYAFNEDGSYAGTVFLANVAQRLNGQTNIISSFSEDDDNIYFSLLTNGRAQVLTAPKNHLTVVSELCEYALPDTDIYGAYTSSSGELVLGVSGGLTVCSESVERFLNISKGAVPDCLWNGIDQLYAMDSATGNIYSVSHEALSVSDMVSGESIVNTEENLTISDMTDISVGITGNVVGRIRGQSDRIYSGSFSVMSGINTDMTDKNAVINRFLVLAGTAAAVIVLSVLTWDFYCGILKMHVSILLRQSLLIIMLIFVTLFFLSYFIIVPKVESIVYSDYVREAQLIANSFEDILTGAAADEYEEFIREYGISAAADSNETPDIHIVQNTSGKMQITASSQLYPKGYPADRLFQTDSFTQTVKGSAEHELQLYDRSAEGEKLYLIRSLSDDMYIAVGVRLDGISDAIGNIGQTVNTFLIIGGFVLVLIFMIIENITAGAVRRLRRSVDHIAAGEYAFPVKVNTGDEIEELSKSVKELSAHIIEKTASLEKLNRHYYRFVPLSFLSTLGETQIERVGKSLHAKRRMSIMYLRFDLSRNLTGMDTDELFESINSVYEQIVPIVSQNNGTAYNFLYNGFNAIFPDSSENILHTAIRIREAVEAYNKPRSESGACTADVRIVISEDSVLLGFVGDEMRMQPTAVSNAINIAEEIEKLCRSSGLYIICTESTYVHLPQERCRSRYIGCYTASDGSTVKLYDMFDGDPYFLIKLKEQFRAQFETAVGLFEERDFAGARSKFMDIVKYAPNDGVSRNYMYLAEYNIGAEKPQLTYTVFEE